MCTLNNILKMQNGDDNAALLLIEKFDPVIRKYAYKLSYEDAYEDLRVDFLTMLYKFDVNKLKQNNEGGAVSYIVAAVHSFYCKGLNIYLRSKPVCSFSDLGSGEQYYVQLIPTYDECCDIDLSYLDDILTSHEAFIIRSIYIYGLSIRDISKRLRISRQAVNQAKNRVLKN